MILTVSKRDLWILCAVAFAAVGVLMLSIYDTRSYLFKHHDGTIVSATPWGKLYVYPDATKWISISDESPRFTEVSHTGFCVDFDTVRMPERATLRNFKIVLAKSGRTVFQSSDAQVFTFRKLELGYSATLRFNDVDIPFKDIVVEVDMSVEQDGESKDITRKFYFKANQKYESHWETVYNMMSV